MVGRAGQLAVLREAFAVASQGGYRTVLIGGEAGVGKSRLMAEFTAELGAGVGGAEARVLAGGCLQLGRDGLPFGPMQRAYQLTFAAQVSGATAPVAWDEAARARERRLFDPG
jgi:predicted ATPase